MKKKPTRLLFVCLGNICRSPLAKALFQKRLIDLGLNVLCDAAGTASYHIGSQPDLRTISVAKSLNLDPTHRARQFAKEDFSKFDLIFAMDRNNLSDLQQMAKLPEESNKIFLLSDFSSDPNLKEIFDPYYADLDDFFKVAELLESTIPKIVATFFKEKN